MLVARLSGCARSANAYFLELAPDAQSAGMAGTGLAITDNGSTAIFHNASTIVFSQEVMGASYSYADINKDYSMHSASVFYKIGREGNHGFTVGSVILRIRSKDWTVIRTITSARIYGIWKPDISVL